MDDSVQSMEDWEYSKEGFNLWINNLPVEAEEHFQIETDSIQIIAGRTFLSCMNSVISYETNKIEESQVLLKSLEKKCAVDVGWLKSVRSKFFGQNEVPIKSLPELLEEQIILADTQLCSAILTFLTQDFQGLVKGSWLLRKAWKVYQHTYSQIYDLYQKNITEDDPIPVQSLNTSLPCSSNNTAVDYLLSPSPSDWTVPNSVVQTPVDSSEYSTSWDQTNKLNNVSRSKSLVGFSNVQKRERECQPCDPKSTNRRIVNSNTSNAIVENSMQLNLNLLLNVKNRFNRNTTESEIQPSVIKRLMGAISFGYGVYQLSLSLLPPNFLKLISLFGFEGDRDAGIACLKFCRNSNDMRSPLATLSLLWYYTIGTQLFSLGNSSLKDDLLYATSLLEESSIQYANSAIFLFFKGRIQRLKSNLSEAISSYDAAYKCSAQKEMKLLCLHEVGWCSLIQLDFGTALIHFHELKQNSVFSKSFYTYLTTICNGAFGNFENLLRLRQEILNIISKSNQKEAQLEKYIHRRTEKLPSSERESKSSLYWKFLIYEMLYMWNAIASCGINELNIIIEDCSRSQGDIYEPMIGMSKLVLGCCEANRQNYDAAIKAYRECINMRRYEHSNDVHISAFAHYDLAIVLLKHSKESRQEAKELLKYAQQAYKNYDFENRLGCRIHQALKQLNS